MRYRVVIYRHLMTLASKLALPTTVHFATSITIYTVFIMSIVSQTPLQLSGHYAQRNRWEVLNGPGDSRVKGSQVVKDENLVNAWAMG